MRVAVGFLVGRAVSKRQREHARAAVGVGEREREGGGGRGGRRGVVGE